VDNPRRVVEVSATLPDLVRLVHLSGYRGEGQDAPAAPWSAQRRADEYARLGAYEASKVESDAVVQTTALQRGLPLTVANASTVIGHSVTGESDQPLGLATTVLDVIAGKLRAVPGGSSTFVPAVAVDYLARFMVLLPTVEESRGKSYWVLDDDTPTRPALLRLIAERQAAPAALAGRRDHVVARFPDARRSGHAEFPSPDQSPPGPLRS
jgi:dihydroflavonol-4-reductase